MATMMTWETLYGGEITAAETVAEARERGLSLAEMAAELVANYPQFGWGDAPDGLEEFTLRELEQAADA